MCLNSGNTVLMNNRRKNDGLWHSCKYVISKNGSNSLISEQLNQVNGIPDVRLQRSLSW